MTDTPAPQAPAPAAQPVLAAGPMINVLAQFTRNLSFESPNALACMVLPQGAPPFFEGPLTPEIRINSTFRGRADGLIEFDLNIEGQQRAGNKILFAFELTYTAIVQLLNTPQENAHAVLMIEVPRLLFPYARKILDEAARDGNFGGFMINPPDWVGEYNRSVAADQAAPGQPAPAAPAA